MAYPQTDYNRSTGQEKAPLERFSCRLRANGDLTPRPSVPRSSVEGVTHEDAEHGVTDGHAQRSAIVAAGPGSNRFSGRKTTQDMARGASRIAENERGG